MSHDRQHRPLRTCVGCRAVRPRCELVRIVAGEAGTGTLDRAQRAPGRGAYLCQEQALLCLRQARRRRALPRSLRIGDNVIDYEALSRQLEALTAEEPPSQR